MNRFGPRAYFSRERVVKTRGSCAVRTTTQYGIEVTCVFPGENVDFGGQDPREPMAARRPRSGRPVCYQIVYT